jgi:hypothetical protein
MLQPKDFDIYVNQVFAAHLLEGGVPVPLLLKGVRVLPGRTQAWLRQQPFALDLHGPAERALRPGSYEVAWPDESRQELLLVQILVGSGPHGARYEIIFN